MGAKKTGISRELLIHPGETIADVLEQRGISQAELAVRTGVSAAYVSNVIAGKKGISAKFALALEYALGVSKSFWINLQANYDVELLELDERNTISDEEKKARKSLKDIVGYLQELGRLSSLEKTNESILSLRRFLQISNLANLKDVVPGAVFQLYKKGKTDAYALGAWIRMCQVLGEENDVETRFELSKLDMLVHELKGVMLDKGADVQEELQRIFADYGIDFYIVRSFPGVPVLGYVSVKQDDTYLLVLTIRNAYADIFWMSLFHELGHIVNGDVSKNAGYIDSGEDERKEAAADAFARDMLISKHDYRVFVEQQSFDIETIRRFASTQYVMPYIVVKRLQEDQKLDQGSFDGDRPIYNWSK